MYLLMIKIVPYDPKWPDFYRAESKVIKNILGENCSEIHHIGSTSIPGLMAKTKIDILAVVKTFSNVDFIALEKVGFEYRGEVLKSGRYLSKKNPHVHLHIYEINNPLIEKHLKFRDWLRIHEEDRNEYTKLKIELSKIYSDGMEFAIAKTDFVNKILEKIDDLVKNNKKLFDEEKKLNLPVGQYAITGSGPMGIRNLKIINDIDIIVTSNLWDELALKYEVFEDEVIQKIVIPDSFIEIFNENSFKKEKSEINFFDRIKNSEIIEGFSFESLENILFYKRKMAREKDLKDIKLIEGWLNIQEKIN